MIEFDAEIVRGSFTLEAAFTAGPKITGVFGPSGSGKSTILALIAGLAKPRRGLIKVGGRSLVDTERGIFIPKYKRRIGLVFQDAQLFPHLTVRQNLAFGRWFAAKDSRLVSWRAVVEPMNIEALLDRRPTLLSGGERQRVALARALLSGPELLLMDEPLASLDDARRAEILSLIERVRDEFGIPILYVTHSTDEVLRLADDVVMLEAGRVARVERAERLRTQIKDGSAWRLPAVSPYAAEALKKP